MTNFTHFRHTQYGVISFMETTTPEQSKKLFSSKVSIVGLFAVLTLILAVPLLVLLSQERQDPRGRAAENPTVPTKSAPPSQGASSLSGYVYIDTNKNGEREAEEKPYAGAIIKVSQIRKEADAFMDNKGNDGKVVNTVSEVKTDSLGYFKFRFSNTNPNSLTYMVKLELPTGYTTISTNPVVFSGVKNDAQEVLQFGIFPLNAVNQPVSPTPTLRIVRPPTGAPQVCLQVLTPARNTTTRVCNVFSNSCLPVGWVKDTSCQQQTQTQQKSISPTPTTFQGVQGD